MKKYEHTGLLKPNSEGRYSLSDGYYWTSGDSIEIFYDEEWLHGTIEYNHEYKDYYFRNDDEGIYVYGLGNLEAGV